MIVWVVFLTLFSGSYAASIRIVNGTNAREGEFPFAVSLRRNLGHTCGATILNERRVLTAAHCTCSDGGRPQDASLFTIQYGSIHISATTDRSIQVSRIHCHFFNFDEIINDVSVLELETPIPDDHTWAPVHLARQFDSRFEHRGVIIGWGRLWEGGPIPTILQKLDVDVYSDLVCGINFDPTQHVCFGAPVGGACHGDSGTSLIVQGEQAAIASFITTTCGISNQRFPNVYAKVTAFLDFIDEHSAL